MTEMPTTGTVPTFDKADRLAKALQHARVSVQDMADELGVSRNTVGNYLNRRTTIGRAALRVWALRTGVPFEWLENGESPTSSPTPGSGATLPRLDSNQQPSVLLFPQVRAA